MTSADTIAGAAAESPLENGLRVVPDYQEKGPAGQSDTCACLCPLLEAMGWPGRSHHLAESIPHFVSEFGVEELRVTLANMNLITSEISAVEGKLDARLLPCIFIPERGAPRVLLSRDEAGTRIFNGATRREEVSTARNLRGRAILVRAAEAADLDSRGQLPWLYEVNVRFRTLLIQVLIASFCLHLASVATPLFMLAVYDSVIPASSMGVLAFLVAGALSAIGLEWTFRRMRSRLMAHVAGRMDYLIGTSGFQQILGLPLAMTENEPLGTQIAHLQEFESVREFFAGPIGEALLDVPFVLLLLTVIAILGGWLVLVPITMIGIIVLISLAVQPFVARATSASARASARYKQFLIEAVSGMRAIKFSAAEQVWMERCRNLSADAAMADFRASIINNALTQLGRTATMASAIAVIGFGALGVMDGRLSIGELVASMTLCWMALGPFQAGLVAFNRLTQIRASIQQINHLMRLRPERAPGAIPPKRSYFGRILFLGVSYRHKTAANPALSGVSFQVEPGEMVAITGNNGSGKTTVINLASGLYKPQTGAILIDGIDIRQLDARDIRQSIGMVPQQSELLYGTVAQNLRLSNPIATDEDLEEAARVAAIDEAIRALPDGYDTRLTERVISELPEGFKQKITIARALLRKPAILIFDEPGQMLDERGDHAFLAALKAVRGKVTVLVVTHRPSHMRLADKVVVLQQGRVRFVGPYAEIREQFERAHGGE